jgi:hypothetical protein
MVHHVQRNVEHHSLAGEPDATTGITAG